MNNQLPDAWHPMSNPVDIKHLGKLGEELGELSRIVSRTLIQGLDGIDPSNDKINCEELENEMTDVIANIELCIEHFHLRFDRARANKKKSLQPIWHKDA